MTLKNNKAPLLFYFKLVASFRNHWCIETWVTVQKRPIWVKIDDFFSRVTSKFDVWPWKTTGHLFYATSSFVHHFIAIGEFKLELKSGNAQSGSNSTIFSAVWPWNLADDLEQGKSEGFDSCDLPGNLAQILSKSSIFQPVWPWNLMHDLKQGKSEGFQSCHQPIIRKRPIWVKIGDVLYRVTLKFDGWPWKTIGHLSFAVSSFVQHFIAIDEFKLELKSGNAQFGSNSTIFTAVWPWNLTYDLEQGKSEGFESCDRPIVRKHPIWVEIGDVLSRVTLKFDVWPWTRQIWGIWKLRPAYSPETPNLGRNRWCFVPCDLEIWWMTLENNRAPLLCCFKLCATFHSHPWIQTGVAVRKRPIWVKFYDF